MKFCDKLQKLRKEFNITQEGLADKLNVSRQAVSKWESGTGYPDTEKLIQISKIFNVTMDELVNDGEIKRESSKEELVGLKEIVKKVIDFIMKSINMFTAMSFKEKIVCLGEMIFISLMLYIIGSIIESLGGYLLRKIFSFLPHNILSSITQIVSAIIYIIWLILGLTILIRIFKTRYLDYYVVVKDAEVEKIEIEKPIPELKREKDIKVVIRDPKDSSNSLFSKLGHICLIILKICFIMFIIPIIIFFIFLISIFVISLFYLSYGLLFTGITISLLGCILFTFIIIWFTYNIISNQKQSLKKLFIIFIISISLIGVGIGLSINSLDTYKIVEKESYYEEDTLTIPYKDNLIINDLYYLNSNKIVIDNTKNDIVINISKLKGTEINTSTHDVWSNDKIYSWLSIYSNNSEYNYLKMTLDSLKNKEILVGGNPFEVDKVYISMDNLTKLKENYQNYNE